jgi:hypothetical protein
LKVVRKGRCGWNRGEIREVVGSVDLIWAYLSSFVVDGNRGYDRSSDSEGGE